MWPMGRRNSSWALAVCVVLAFLAGPGVASAHLRTGTIAVDYETSVRTPVTAAYSAQIYESDHGLTLTLRPGHVVILRGYLGEPVFRLDRAGLWVNAASPTAVAAGLLHKSQAVDAPTPRWRLQASRRSVAWHDARTQGLPPGVDQGRWRLPLIVDGRSARLEGEMRRFAAPSIWPWLAVLACLLAAGAGPLRLRGRDHARRVAKSFAAVAAAAAVMLPVGFALDAYASPGAWIEGFDAFAFIAVGLWVMLRGPEHLRLAGAIGVGLVGVAVGLLAGPVFLHPIVLAILPGTVVRLLVVAAIGAGLSAAALGCLFHDEIIAPAGEGERALGFPPADAELPGRTNRPGRIGL
jgi:hypothetical protein